MQTKIIKETKEVNEEKKNPTYTRIHVKEQKCQIKRKRK